MAYPDDAGTDHRTVVRAGRTKSIALWSGSAEPFRPRPVARRAAPGGLLVGSVFLDHPAAGRRGARHGAVRSCRATSTRPRSRSITSAASSRSCSSDARPVDQLRSRSRTREPRARPGGGRRCQPRRLPDPAASRDESRSTTSTSPGGGCSGSPPAPGSSCSARSWARCSSGSSSSRTCSATRPWRPGRDSAGRLLHGADRRVRLSSSMRAVHG